MPTHSLQNVREASTTALGGNMSYRGLEWQPNFVPEYQVYLFNVSARTFDSFGLGKLGRAGVKVEGVRPDDPTIVTLPDGKTDAGKVDEHYRYFTSIPHPMMLTKPNLESNEIDTVKTDGRRFAIDMINPDNLTLSLGTVIPQEQVFSVGNDYSRKGIFFSLVNPPLQSDLRAAIDRMEGYYKALLEQAATLELVDKNKLSEALAGNPDYSFAANYFGKDVAWNRKQTRPVLCPNCGEQKQGGMKFHTASDGGLCVEPTVDAWKMVVSSGRRPYEAVPDEYRWRSTSVADLAAKMKGQSNP
jgi:hypothetical protein